MEGGKGIEGAVMSLERLIRLMGRIRDICLSYVRKFTSFPGNTYFWTFQAKQSILLSF